MSINDNLAATEHIHSFYTVQELRALARRWGITPIPSVSLELRHKLQQVRNAAIHKIELAKKADAKKILEDKVRQPQESVRNALTYLVSLNKDESCKDINYPRGLRKLNHAFDDADLVNESDVIEQMSGVHGDLLDAQKKVDRFSKMIVDQNKEMLFEIEKFPFNSHTPIGGWLDYAIKEYNTNHKNLTSNWQSLSRLGFAATILIASNPKAIDVLNQTVTALKAQIAKENKTVLEHLIEQQSEPAIEAQV